MSVTRPARVRLPVLRGAGGRRTHERGQSLVEFALVVPILLLIFAAAGDLGRAFYSYVAIENGVKEGALFGARTPLCATDASAGCANPGNVQWRVRNELESLRNTDGSALTPTAECLAAGSGVARAALRDCAAGDTYRVSLTYPFRFLTPIIGDILGGSLDLTSSSSAVVLNLAFDPTPGASVQKLVSPANARNGAEIIAKCTEPDDSDSNGYYRSPCRDTSTPDPLDTISLTFESGATIGYRITVGNSGGQGLNGVSVVDSTGSIGCSLPASWAIGYAQSCQYTRTAPTVPGGRSSLDYANVLTVDANEILPVSDDVTVRVEPAPPEWDVDVYVSPFALGADGDGVPSFGTAGTLDQGVNGILSDESAWFKLVVRNIGGSAATGVTITSSLGALPFGQSSATAVCDPQPASMAAGAQFICRYRVAVGSAGTVSNTVTARAANATPTSKSDTATVTATSCTGASRLIPNLVGLQKASAAAEWTAAGFPAGGLTQWGGNPNATVVAQSRPAYSCVATTTTMTISRTQTP